MPKETEAGKFTHTHTHTEWGGGLVFHVWIKLNPTLYYTHTNTHAVKIWLCMLAAADGVTAAPVYVFV